MSPKPCLRVLLLAGALLLLCRGAAAQCKADPVDAAPVTGCATCSKDGTKCEACAPYYGLTSAGTCVKCTAPGYYGDKCVECKGDAPSVCTKCEADCGRRSCRGLYADSEGWCLPCGPGCNDCNPDGTCAECGRFEGLVNGTCSRCADGCFHCEGAINNCTDCLGGFAFVEATKTCLKCPGSDEGVSDCDPTGKITSCAGGWYLEAGACKTCSLANCSDCASATECSFCDTGFLLSNGTCQPCQQEGCGDCSEGLDKCSFCGDGYGLVAGKCVKCADPKCQSCPDDASKCLSCVFVEGSPPMGIDLKTGACTACPDKCSACSDDAATCAFCVDGYSTDETATPPACKACPAGAASCVFSASGVVADACTNGFSLRNGTCVACEVPNCQYCEKLGPQSCDASGCAEGFGLDYKANQCVPCKEGCGACDSYVDSCSACKTGYWLDGATCVQCKAGDEAVHDDCVPVDASAPSPSPAEEA